MSVTATSFQNAFEEYRKTDSALVEAKLKIARMRVAPKVWGSKADAGVMYLTAHLLALAPAGQNAKLKPENAGKTVYLQEFNRMKLEVTTGLRTAGLVSPAALVDPNNG